MTNSKHDDDDDDDDDDCDGNDDDCGGDDDHNDYYDESTARILLTIQIILVYLFCYLFIYSRGIKTDQSVNMKEEAPISSRNQKLD